MPILLNLSKEFIYLIIYRNNKIWAAAKLIFLLLPVTRYRHVSWDYLGTQLILLGATHRLP